MKTYRKIDLLICHKSSNLKSGYTDYKYECSTIEHRTLKSAIMAINNTGLIAEDIIDIKRCKAGMLGITRTGYNKVLAIIDKNYTGHKYNQKLQAV